MSPNTFEALAILVVAFADRMMRFLAVSIVVHLTFGWLEYLAWRIGLRHEGEVDVAQFAALWGAAIVVIGTPTFVGWSLGSLYASRNARTTRYVRLRKTFGLSGHQGAERESVLLETALDRAPAPRAWDHLFGSSPSALIRMQLTNDAWIGGLFGDASYASGYPETSGDIYLERSVQMETDGTFSHDDDDNLVEVGAGILIRWDEVRVLDFFEYPEDADAQA